MRNIWFVVILTISITSLSSPAGEKGIIGKWVFMEDWKMPPYPKRGGPPIPHQWSYGTLIRFCANGDFHMATGGMHRTNNGATLVSDNALRIYKGKWAKKHGTYIVHYRLAFYKVLIDGEKKTVNTLAVSEPQINDKGLLFDLVQYSTTLSYNRVQFINCNALSYRFSDCFVECQGQ